MSVVLGVLLVALSVALNVTARRTGMTTADDGKRTYNSRGQWLLVGQTVCVILGAPMLIPLFR